MRWVWSWSAATSVITSSTMSIRLYGSSGFSRWWRVFLSRNFLLKVSQIFYRFPYIIDGDSCGLEALISLKYSDSARRPLKMGGCTHDVSVAALSACEACLYDKSTNGFLNIFKGNGSNNYNNF